MATIEWRGKNKDIAYISYSEGGQGQIRISLGKITQQEAEAIRLEKSRQIDNPSIYFESFTKSYLPWHEAEYPDSHDRIDQITTQYLIPFFGDTAIETINELNLERYKAHRLTPVAVPGKPDKVAAADTVNKELRTFNAILNRAVRWKKIEKNPITDLPIIKILNSKPIHFYTADDLEALYIHSNHFHHIWQFLANTGLRRSEYLQFDPTTNIKDGSLIIESTNDQRTKSGKWRMIPISKGAETAMKSDYIYTGRKESLSRAFRKCATRADIGGSLHSLRHTFCSHLVMQGVPLRTVQVLAGHSNITVTERYAHLSPDYLAKTVQNLSL